MQHTQEHRQMGPWASSTSTYRASPLGSLRVRREKLPVPSGCSLTSGMLLKRAEKCLRREPWQDNQGRNTRVRVGWVRAETSGKPEPVGGEESVLRELEHLPYLESLVVYKQEIPWEQRRQQEEPGWSASSWPRTASRRGQRGG